MTLYKLPKVSGVAHIIEKEKEVVTGVVERAGIRRIKKFREILRKSGMIWNETHYVCDKLGLFFECHMVKFEWYNLGKLPK